MVCNESKARGKHSSGTNSRKCATKACRWGNSETNSPTKA
jgi:hypothetical protein